eukprot:10685452-Heterocapsa_arctica.AAC.1
MLDDVRNRAPDLVWVVLVGQATGRGSSKDGKGVWDIAKLVHEQINNKQYVLLEANAVAYVWEMEAIHQLPNTNTYSHPQHHAHRLPTGEHERSA